MLQYDRVRETADAITEMSTRMVELLADIDKVLNLNSNLSIPWSNFVGKVVTADGTANTLTSTAHGWANGTPVRLAVSTGGALPTSLTANTTYFVVSTAANTFQLATAVGGAAIDFTGNGTGTITAYNWPDYVQLESNGNLNGRSYDAAQVSNAVGSLDWVRKLLTNQTMTGSQGDHRGNLNQLARAQG